jgi:hypothetical protein
MLARRYTEHNALIAHAEEESNYPLLVFTMLLQLYNQCEVDYLAPIKPTPTENKLPQMFADRTRDMMREVWSQR